MAYLHANPLINKPMHTFKRGTIKVWIATVCIFIFSNCFAQSDSGKNKHHSQLEKYYGTASFYANKFVGKKTANGEIFSQKKLTAASNILPLGTWVKVTNIRNNKSVVVKINDRLHKKNKRIIDLTKSGAQKLGFLQTGLTRVKIEIVERQ